MVKKKELRKGILVHLNGPDDVLKVVDVKKFREVTAIFEDGRESEIGRLDGIPLTIRWIEKLGFKDQTGGWGGSQGSDYVFKKSGIEIRSYDIDNYWHLSSDFNLQFEFVHQLQNYFYEKTGKVLSMALK